jgi:AP-4 complex subunit mu-1
MGLIKHFFCLNSRGNPIVVRGFLTESSHAVVEAFFNRVVASPPPEPVFRLDGMNFAFIRQSQIYFVLASEDSMSPMILLELLSRLCNVFSDYASRCTEVVLQRNLSLVYEIVDEVLSFGCPQATDSWNLLHLVHNTIQLETTILEDINVLDILSPVHYDRPLAVSVSDRAKAANDVYVVHREIIELSLDRNNQALHGCITGQVTCKSYLQGLASVMLRFDPQMYFTTRSMQQTLELGYDDIVFAPFVQAHSFDADRSISFAPPQGLTTLLSYRTIRPIVPPFTITPEFENKQVKVIVVRVSVQSAFRAELSAQSFELRFQCPVETSNASCELPPSVQDKQKGEYDAKTRQVVWKVDKFPGLSEFSARFRFIFDNGIPGAAETLLGPVSVGFVLPEVLPSGASLKSLDVSTSGSSAPPKSWVKAESVATCYTFNLI